MTTETMSPEAERIVATMKRKGLTQSAMADYLGVPHGTLVNWLKGRREPNVMVNRLLDVLGTVEALAPALHASLMPKGKR